MQHAPDYLRRTDLIFATPEQKGSWNPNFPPKFWRDPGSLGLNSVSYNGVGQTGIQKFIVSDAQWGFNIPPTKVDYPPYVVEPTQANIGGTPLNPQKLSAWDQANKLNEDLGGRFIIQERILQGFPVNYGSEARRIWLLVDDSHQYVVGDLLAIQNEFGVGVPGNWFGMNWVPDTNETVIPKDPPVQVPLRDLRPGETIVQTLGGWLVDDNANLTPTSPLGGGDGNSDQLTRIESKLDKLLSAVGVQS